MLQKEVLSALPHLKQQVVITQQVLVRFTKDESIIQKLLSTSLLGMFLTKER